MSCVSLAISYYYQKRVQPTLDQYHKISATDEFEKFTSATVSALTKWPLRHLHGSNRLQGQTLSKI
jgi:hypothetical protein